MHTISDSTHRSVLVHAGLGLLLASTFFACADDGAELARTEQTVLVPSAVSFEEFSSVLTAGAADWEYFQIGTDHYLVVANSRGISSYDVNSTLYRWDGQAFLPIQSILTHNALDWEHFEIDGVPYLAVANQRNSSTRNIDSQIYQWNGTSFVDYQAIPTMGAHDWEYFQIDGMHYLAVANYFNSQGAVWSEKYNTDSKIYQWDGDSFEEYQAILTSGARDWEYFEIAGEHYLAVANYYDSQTRFVDSQIYKWNGASFVPFQAISTIGADSWENFQIGTDHFLAIANESDGPITSSSDSRHVDSEIYRWNGTSFVVYQTIPTVGAHDWTHFEIGADHFLAVANHRDDPTHNIDSVVYRWNAGAFEVFQNIATSGAADWEFFQIDGESYLALASYSDDSTTSIESKIYSTVLCGDGVVEGPEQCDDENADNTDGCLTSCVIPASCLEIHEEDPSVPTGPALVGVRDSLTLIEVECDMDTDGGGWTGLDLPHMCSGDLTTAMDAPEPVGIDGSEGIDAECRPFTRDTDNGHTYTFDFGFPAGFDAFYLQDYVIKANAGPGDVSEMRTSFAQSDWVQAYESMPPNGDVSFGCADEPGPVTSYSAQITENFECNDCDVPFPGGSTPYMVGATCTTFRIGWGETGEQSEGWYPWWSGTVYVR